MTILWQQDRWPRRVAFAAGNLAAVAGILLVGILPIRDWLVERDRQIDEQRVTLARFKAVAGREAAVRSASGEIAADSAEFLAGKSEGVIGADLQTRLKGMAEAAGAKLRSVRGLPAFGDERMRYVGSRIEILGPLAAVHRAVHAIETAKPYLFVKGAVLRLSPPAGQNPGAPVIEAQLDVFGAVRIEAAGK